MFWKTYLCLTIFVLSIFYFDRFIADKPKSRFGKWWRKHIINRQDD